MFGFVVTQSLTLNAALGGANVGLKRCCNPDEALFGSLYEATA